MSFTLDGWKNHWCFPYLDNPFLKPSKMQLVSDENESETGNQPSYKSNYFHR